MRHLRVRGRVVRPAAGDRGLRRDGCGLRIRAASVAAVRRGDRHHALGHHDRGAAGAARTARGSAQGRGDGRRRLARSGARRRGARARLRRRELGRADPVPDDLPLPRACRVRRRRLGASRACGTGHRGRSARGARGLRPRRVPRSRLDLRSGAGGGPQDPRGGAGVGGVVSAARLPARSARRGPPRLARLAAGCARRRARARHRGDGRHGRAVGRRPARAARPRAAARGAHRGRPRARPRPPPTPDAVHRSRLTPRMVEEATMATITETPRTRGAEAGGTPRGSSPDTRAGSRKRRGLGNLTGWAFVAPAMVIILGLSIFPAVWAFILSLQKWNGFAPPKFVGGNNYGKLLSDEEFWAAVSHTGLYVLLFVPASVLLGLFLAVALNRDIALIGLYRTAIFVPFVASA